MPGELLVRLQKGTSIATVQRDLSQSLTSTPAMKSLSRSPHGSGYHKLIFDPASTDERELEKSIARLPGVEAVSLNYRLVYRAEPNDEDYGVQWNLEDINVEPVWDVTTGGTMANGMRIGVALSDLAIQTGHPDLAGNIWPLSPAQGSGTDHGTEVASVMGAVGNNTIGIAGVNWDVEIFSSGETTDLSDAIEQFEAATFVREQFNASNGANGLMVVSITASWGVPDPSACNGFMEPLLTDMTSAGILLVTSGPNEPQDLDVEFDFPSNCALAEHLVVTSYGQLNEVPYATGANSVHLLAPGLNIPAASVGGGGYAVVDGNSFAIPTVAGAIALLYSVPCPAFAQLVMNDPVAARQLVKDAILNNTAPFPGGSAITITGGKLDVYAAFQALMAQCAPSCVEHTITLTTTGDPVTSYTITDASLNEVASGGGNAIEVCLEDGCFSINLLGSNGLPMEADFVVEDANGVIAAGSSIGGVITFNTGNVVPGCTVAGSGNYNPQANCNDGTCCTGNVVRMIIAPEDLGSEGTAQVEISSSGSTLFNGTVDILFDPDFGVPVGSWQGCVPGSCLSIAITGSSVDLFPEGFLYINGSTNPDIEFSTTTGFNGSISNGTEECDGLDNDCDGEVDEDFIWFVDADGDGFGLAGTGTVQCIPPSSGFSQTEGDCNDTNPLVFPDAPDACADADGLDNDCDGEIDEDGFQTWYADLDGDGFGTTATATVSCLPLPDHSLTDGDCDDDNTAINPGEQELCDGVDNDCDLVVDDGFQWYPDTDGDGWGDLEGVMVISCVPVPGHSQVIDDCDDNNADLTAIGQPCDDGNPNTIGDAVNANCFCIGASNGNCPPGEVPDCNGHCAPIDWIGDGVCDDGQFEHEGVNIFFTCAEYNFDNGDCANCVTEVCDGADNDCDGQVDEDFIWFVDADGDGHGDPNSMGVICEPPATGFSQSPDDCDDTNAAIYMNAVEICDGFDNDCNGITDGITQDFQSGCSDPMACNYDPGAVCDTGGCVQGSIADGTETFATDFTATDVNGNTVNLFALLAQGKTVILDFFTTWCPPSNAMNSESFLQDWYAHMGPAGLDHIRLVSIEVEDTATATGSLAPFLADATWPFIAQGGNAISVQYNALGLYNNAVPTLVMICPDRSARVIYPTPMELPVSGLFHYEPEEAFLLINEKCGCRGTPCLSSAGCMDVNACNYDPSATCPGPCTLAQEWFVDADGDGYGSTTSLGILCTQPANSAADSTDCDDANPTVHMGFTLFVLTGNDNDVGTAHYVIEQGSLLIEGDLDLVGPGQGLGALPVCLSLGCYSITITENNVPLNSESFILFPSEPGEEEYIPFDTQQGYQGGGTAETCDGIDNDCDGDIDENFDLQYADNDGDGYGDPLQPLPCDTPGVANPDDCNDNDPLVFPGQGCGACTPADIAWFVNGNQPDIACISDCSGPTPEEIAACLALCYTTAGLGEPCAECFAEYQVCVAINCPECADDPNSPDCLQCRQINGCDAQFTACSGLQDNDGDGYYSYNDCDDNNASIHPGTLEGCSVDGIDNDCDGQVDEDAVADQDADGFAFCDGDCNDLNFSVNPGQPEVCDGIDNNCDGLIDEGFTHYFSDLDGDGFGDPSAPQLCDPVGGVTNQLDCDDSDATTYAGAPELCDGIDNNCDAQVDEIVSDDADLDGYTPCAGDCDDGNPDVHPAADEVCDGLDNNCDGNVDEGLPPGMSCPADVAITAPALACAALVDYDLPELTGCGDAIIALISGPGPGEAFGFGTTPVQYGLQAPGAIGPVLLQEDFEDNSAGWILDAEWNIAPASASNCGSTCTGNDPATDHTPGSGNGVAGMSVGGCISTSIHPFRYLTSPFIDASAGSSLTLSFYRHLHGDYAPYMQHHVQVFNGGGWITIWSHSPTTCVNDEAWTLQEFDVTAHMSSQFAVRFGTAVGAGGALHAGGWNVDDVVLMNDLPYLDTCTFNVVVTAAESGASTPCGAPLQLSTEPGLCGVANAQLPLPEGSLLCVFDTLFNTAPSVLPVGTSSFQWIAEHPINGSDTCTQEVSVVDNESPTIDCGPMLSITADAMSCTATNVVLDPPSATDNCAVVSLTNDHPSTSYPAGSTLVTWTATDAAGNSNTCTQLVNVAGNSGQPPVLTCPGDTLIVIDPLNCDATFDYAPPTLLTNCVSTPLPLISGLPSGSEFPEGTTQLDFALTGEFLNEDFSDNSNGWLLDSEWMIGAATASACAATCSGNDPANDHSITADEGIAGMVIGGCVTSSLHSFQYLTSPPVDASGASVLTLEFWRHLHGDYAPFMQHHVQVFDGNSWITVWTHGLTECLHDADWTLQSFDVTAFKNDQFRARIGMAVGSSGAYSSGGWSVDDLRIFDPTVSAPTTCSFQVTVSGLPTWYLDQDGDGFGGNVDSILVCAQPSGYAEFNGDCDDFDATIAPLATELCDGIDNNCNGLVDEVCTPETCDGIDNDGDGLLDADDPDLTLVPCENQEGVCGGAMKGPELCVGGIWLTCSAADYLNYSAQYDPSTDACDGLDNDCDAVIDEDCGITLVARVFLEGPYNPGTGLMNDGMRALGLVPTVEPYTGLGYVHVGGGGETTTPAVLAISGNDAIADWVVLELRDAVDPSIIVATRSALVQRDGDIVDTDGTSAVSMFVGQGNYHVAVRHRNHLGAMTLSTEFLFSGGTIVDFTLPATGTYGLEACRVLGAVQLLWCGDVTFDGVVKYTGLNNDRDPILIDIGGTVPTNTISGYQDTDVNLDGTVKYTGGANDRDPILITVGGSVPTAVRVQQLP